MNIKKVLKSDETVKKEAKASLVPFAIPGVLGALVLVAGIIMCNVGGYSNSGLTTAGVIMCIAGGLIFIYSLTILENSLSTRIYITDRRAIITSGVLNSKLSEIPLDKLSGITVVEPLLGKMFNYGTFVVESSAMISGVKAKYIKDPYGLKNSLDK